MRPAFCCTTCWQARGLLILLAVLVIQAQELKLVNIIYRHGDRSPAYTYATDPWKNEFPEGWNQLTKLGKQQEFELGKYFRKRYASFLNYTAYIPPQIHVRSSDTDRTLMSAGCILAGMFPPTGKQVWNPAIKWQPLPVHGQPLNEDYLFNGYEVCHKFAQLLKEAKSSPEAQKFNEENKDLFDLVTVKTGINVTNLFKACDVHDIFVVHQAHNLTWPDWLNKTTMARLEQCLIQNHMLSTKSKQQRRLNGGVIVGDIIKNMQANIDGMNSTKKMYMYSAHDWNIVYFLTTLDIYNSKRAPYSASIFVELLEDNKQYFVKIFYRNVTNSEPFELSLPYCPSPCPFEQFKTLTADMVPNDYVKECSVTLLASSESPESHNWQMGIVIALISLFTILSVFLLVATFCTNRVSSPSRQPLLADSTRKRYGLPAEP